MICCVGALGLGEARGAADPPDREALLRDFRGAFSKDFDVVGERFARIGKSSPYWVVEVKPKRFGHFDFRCEYQEPWGFNAQTVKRACEFRVAVGKQGEPRLHWRADFWQITYPLANVGDTILLPFPIGQAIGQPRFGNLSQSKAPLQLDEGLDKARQPAPPGAALPFELHNNALAGHLSVIRLHTSSTVDRAGATEGHELGAVFEAAKPGRFNLVSGPVASDDVRRAQVAVVIVARNTPLRVLADGTPDYYRPATVVMREGDQAALGLWSYRTRVVHGARQGSGKYPAIVIERLDFKDLPNPFGIDLVPPEAPLSAPRK
jgi:hypothetical protein